jgi:hypothetical protein
MPIILQSKQPQVIKTLPETRQLIKEELALLHSKRNMSYSFGAIVAAFGICIGVFMFFFAHPVGLIFFFVFAFPGICFCFLFIYTGRKSDKDEKNGIAEIIKGKITDKYHSGRGGTTILVVNDKIIPIEYPFWNSVNIGDSISVEIGPYSDEIFNLKKS